MTIYIDQLHEPRDVVLDVESEVCHLPSEVGDWTTPIHVEAHVRKIHEKIIISGRISAALLMPCSRCLTPYTERLEDDFALEYLPEPDFQDHEEDIELDEADLDISYYTGHSIALNEVLREQLLLRIPLQPLCRQDCAGLCPSCGTNLNEDSCGCDTRQRDSRLAVLEKLLPHNE